MGDISSVLEEKWDVDDLIYKPKLEKCRKNQIRKSQKMTRSVRVLKVSFSDLGPPSSN